MLINLDKLLKKALVFVSAGVLAACTPVDFQSNKSIIIDGFSTVYPITKAVADEYKKQKQPSADINVNFSGTTGGFRQFCAGKPDISNASRPIPIDEIEACNRNNIRFIELLIAFDALTIAVNKENTWLFWIWWVKCILRYSPPSEGVERTTKTQRTQRLIDHIVS